MNAKVYQLKDRLTEWVRTIRQSYLLSYKESTLNAKQQIDENEGMEKDKPC